MAREGIEGQRLAGTLIRLHAQVGEEGIALDLSDREVHVKRHAPPLEPGEKLVGKLGKDLVAVGIGHLLDLKMLARLLNDAILLEPWQVGLFPLLDLLLDSVTKLCHGVETEVLLCKLIIERGDDGLPEALEGDGYGERLAFPLIALNGPLDILGLAPPHADDTRDVLLG